MSRITVTTKLNMEEYEFLKDYVDFQGKTVNAFLKEVILRELGTEKDDKIDEICRLYEIDKKNLFKSVQWLLDSKKLHVVDGRLKWNPRAIDEEYFSIDDEIDRMNLSPKEEKRLKQEIRDNLRRMVNNDYTGNGGGL